ncbi:DUF3105 domain-containing protein [Streptomyces sp. AM 4-1-1]|uniref:DUF3105 domain-containing protein n=1 Tax=unclassified Streptomyces TaxID=2593676 RepID=UPI0023B8C6DC|nr:DUF3105 domain-containing protein [Streptomyces sp. AM 4-1-1]WEH33069.1 DUF3105 domain-containing protein [Streptomyces sp. AM 4-1-1]
MSFDRRTRIEQLRNTERARERRNRVLAISLSAVVVAGLVGFGSYMLLENSEASEAKQTAQESDAKHPDGDHGDTDSTDKAPIEGEKSWDAKTLTRNHVTTAVTYPMKPPVGGDHNPVWMNCDGKVYKKAIPDVNAVHALEHGSVWVTYTDKAPDADVRKLAERVEKTPYSLMSPYEDQAGTIMLSAWGKQVTVDGADDPRVAKFFARYVQGPQTPEPGASCTGGLEGE